MNQVIKYYQWYDEENRLKKDNMHRVEYDTTIFYLNKIIKANHKILDVGAGTGAYSFYYASKGNRVIALDISSKNIDIMKNKLENLKDKVNLEIKVSDGRNSLDYRDNSFDIVLCMGPLYHIKNKDARLKCIKECLRVLKKDGKLIISYINKYAAFVNKIASDNEYINKTEVFNILENKHSEKDDCFVYTEPDELRNMLHSLEVEEIINIATDGIGHMMSKAINSYSEEEYQKWLSYHLNTCTKDILLGYSLHGLYICKKK